MAEALLRECGEGLFQVESAGCDPAGYVHPLAMEMMSEVGLDIAGWVSKSHEEFLDREIHTVVTVCGNAFGWELGAGSWELGAGSWELRIEN